MSKNDMKLIMEGWRHSLKEMNAVQTGGVQTGAVTKKEEINEEELDEGMKEIALVGGLTMAAFTGDAAAGGVDGVLTADISHQQMQQMDQVFTNVIDANADNPNIDAYKEAHNAVKYIVSLDPDETVTQGAISSYSSTPALQISDKAQDAFWHLADKIQTMPERPPEVPGTYGGPDASSGQSTNAEVVLQMLQIQKQKDPQAAAQKAQSILDRAAQDGGGGVANMTPDIEKGLKAIAGVNETSLRESSI